MQSNPLYEEPDEKAPGGFFAGRRIITRDTPVYEGVYLGSGAREAVVVDDDKYTSYYDILYSEIIDQIYEVARSYPESSVQEKVLQPVFEAVRRAMPYNDEAVHTLTSHMVDKKINLGAFLKAKAGVCRHQALMTAYIMERLQKDQELVPKDRISVDRNTIPGVGGHAWLRYTAEDGEVYIVDPAQEVVGKLSELQDVYWDYKRPEES